MNGLPEHQDDEEEKTPVLAEQLQAKIDANLWMPVKAFWQHVNGTTRLFNGKIV